MLAINMQQNPSGIENIIAENNGTYKPHNEKIFFFNGGVYNIIYIFSHSPNRDPSWDKAGYEGVV